MSATRSRKHFRARPASIRSHASVPCSHRRTWARTSTTRATSSLASAVSATASAPRPALHHWPEFLPGLSGCLEGLPGRDHDHGQQSLHHAADDRGNQPAGRSVRSALRPAPRRCGRQLSRGTVRVHQRDGRDHWYVVPRLDRGHLSQRDHGEHGLQRPRGLWRVAGADLEGHSVHQGVQPRNRRRISKYSTSGTSYTFKALGDWQVNDWLRLRGGFNRAERAPNIAELLLTPQQSFATDPIGDVCSTRNQSTGSANPNATPRRARSMPRRSALS